MTDAQSALLTSLFILMAVFLFLGIQGFGPKPAPTSPRPLPVTPWAWRHCLAGCSKMLTNDHLAPCPVCGRALAIPSSATDPTAPINHTHHRVGKYEVTR